MKILATQGGWFDGVLRQPGDLFESDGLIGEDLPAGMIVLPDDVPAPASNIVLRKSGGGFRLISDERIIYPVADALAEILAHSGEDA